MPVYIISRRSFLQTASAAFAGSLTLPLFAQGKDIKKKKAGNHKADVVFDNYSGHYSLRAITPILDKYRVPAGSIRPDTWTLTYDMYISVPGRSASEKQVSAVAGILQLGRKADAYQMIHKLCKNMAESVCTETSISADETGTLGWKANRSFTLPGQTLPAFEEKAMLEKNTLKLSKQKIAYALELSKNLVSLPHLVHGMMKKNFPASFSFLDEQCAVWDEQVAKTAETISISCASGSHKLAGVHQHGRGQHPAHYWLDDRGIPIFITRGMRSYALAEIGGDSHGE